VSRWLCQGVKESRLIDQARLWRPFARLPPALHFSRRKDPRSSSLSPAGAKSTLNTSKKVFGIVRKCARGSTLKLGRFHPLAALFRYNLTHLKPASESELPPGRLVSLNPFIASPPIERRHARQRITKKCRRKTLLLSQLLPAITISHCQRIGPNAWRERKRQSFIQDFGHCSLPPYGQRSGTETHQKPATRL
jgi:hypothetical protein